MALSWQKKEAEDSPAQTITGADYSDDIVHLANSLAQAEYLRQSLHVNTDKTEYLCFNQRGDISPLGGGVLWN